MPVTLSYWDLTGDVDVESLSCCPLCDHPCWRGEELKIVEVEKVMGLAHANCCETADEDQP